MASDLDELWASLLQQPLLPKRRLEDLLLPPPPTLPQKVQSPQRDLKSPLTKKWNPILQRSLSAYLSKQKRKSLFRIREITEGLTMPNPQSVPLCGAKRMVAAVLFFDLEGFTALASKLGNEDTLFILNMILPSMMLIVQHWNGEIEKSTGDGLMAIFGTETRNNFLIARDAIEAAMAMRYTMEKEIHARLLAEGLPVIPFRIGIEIEKVLIAKIGIQKFNFLSVVGGAANRASKLQELADPDGICVGENVYSNLNPLLHQYCREGKHKDWNWASKGGIPYRFFHFDGNWPDPLTWMKTKL